MQQKSTSFLGAWESLHCTSAWLQLRAFTSCPVCAASETERSLAERSGGTARADQATSALAMEWAGKPEGSLLRQQSDWLNEENRSLPLQQMNTEERLVADYSGTSLTVGQHPMYYRRREL